MSYRGARMSAVSDKYLELLDKPNEINDKTQVLERHCVGVESEIPKPREEINSMEIEENFEETEMNFEEVRDECFSEFPKQQTTDFSDCQQPTISLKAFPSSHDVSKSPPTKRKRVQNPQNSMPKILSSFTENLFAFTSKPVEFDQPTIVDKTEFIKNSEKVCSVNETSNIFVENKQNDEEMTETLIDESMVPEKCRNFQLEKSIMQNETLSIRTFYSSCQETNTNQVIFEYYEVQRPCDWNAVASKMLEKFEPSIDYLYVKLQENQGELGASEYEYDHDMDLSCNEIRDSLQEIEESFETANKSVSSSTPTKADKSSDTKIDVDVFNNTQVTKTTDNLLRSQEISQEKSLAISRNSQRNSQKCNQASQQQNINSVSDVFADPTQRQVSTQKTQQEFPESFQFNLSNFNFKSETLARAEMKKNGSSGSNSASRFHGFNAGEQQNELEKVDPKLNEVSGSQDPLQLLSEQNPSLTDARRAAILSQLEVIFHSLLESLVKRKTMELKIRKIRDWKDCEMNKEVLSQKKRNVTKLVSYGNKNSKKSFTVLVVVMCEVYKMLARNVSCTKRELYYRDVELFRNQEVINKTVNNICSMLNVQEFELGVTTSSKGLVVGALTIIIGDERINCATPRAVPQGTSAVSSFETSAEYVLVVEKDTVFQRLVNDDTFKASISKVVLITAKGYPDINTRILLNKLSAETRLPVYILVDADPHGVEIMCTYKFGSKMMIHNSLHLAVPTAHWIGIHPTDISNLDVTKMALTKADLKKIDELLSRPYIDQKLRNELEHFKTKQFKAEIESLYQFSTDFLLNDYIPKKIRAVDLSAIPLVRFFE